MEHIDKRKETKKEVLNSWSNLIITLHIYLQEVRNHGGTMGHHVGSVKREQIKLMKLFEENL